MLLGVNIDHIATLREARKINDPDPLEAVFILRNAGASQVTLHLREDRRHIHDDDLKAIIHRSPLPINLECASTPEMIELICHSKPHRVTLVPEKREEVTTEGGLDLSQPLIKDALHRLKDQGIATSLFIDPSEQIIEQAWELQPDGIELHTGEWANLFLMTYSNLPHTHHAIASLQEDRDKLKSKLNACLENIEACAKIAKNHGLEVYAGHGLNYQNVSPIAQIPEIIELNIGHSIIARSVFIGLFDAIKEMQRLINP